MRIWKSNCAPMVSCVLSCALNGALAFLLGPSPVAAQSNAVGGYPNRPITLLHAYSPGGGSAVLLRALAESGGKALGQRVVVEDRPGAGGALAPAHMLKSRKPDGYVLAQLAQPLLRMPHIQKAEFDVLNDFTWIIRFVHRTEDYTRWAREQYAVEKTVVEKFGLKP